MTTPLCKQCGVRPVTKNGLTKTGRQRWRSRCGSCQWSNRMSDVRDERSALYKAAQRSEVNMLAERRLRAKLDEKLTECISVAQDRLVLIQDRDSDIRARDMAIAARDAEIASLKDEVAKLRANVDVTFQEKWEWMQKHDRLAAKVKEHEQMQASTKARMKRYIEVEMQRLNEIQGLQAAHEVATAELEEKKATVLDLKTEIRRLDASMSDQTKRAEKRYKRLLEVSAEVESQMSAKLTDAEAWSRKATTVLLIGVIVLLAALGVSVLS